MWRGELAAGAAPQVACCDVQLVQRGTLLAAAGPPARSRRGPWAPPSPASAVPPPPLAGRCATLFSPTT